MNNVFLWLIQGIEKQRNKFTVTGNNESKKNMLQFSQFVWPLSYLVLDAFNNFLLIDATDRSKICSDQKRFFIALSLYPFHFSRTLPLIRHANIEIKDHLKRRLQSLEIQKGNEFCFEQFAPNKLFKGMKR